MKNIFNFHFLRHSFRVPVILIVLVLSYVLIRVFAEDVTAFVSAGPRLDAVNGLLGVEETRPFSFYRGVFENVLFGPLKSVVSGLALLLIGWRFRARLSLFRMTALVFGYLLLTRWEILPYPPFGESVTGPFSDVIWLVRHNLDYVELHHQDPWSAGGPLFYPFSVYSLFCATLLTILPTANAFNVIMHLITFVMAAGVAAMTWDILRRVCGEGTAVLGSVLLVSFPVFQSMSEMINMEMPLAFWVTLCVFLLSTGRSGWATAAAGVAVLLKAPGGTACLVVCGYCLLEVLRVRTLSGTLRYGLCAFAAAAFLLGKLILRIVFRGDQLPQSTIRPGVGWVIIRAMPEFWLFLIIALGGLVWAVYQWHRRGQSWTDLWLKNRPFWLCLGMSTAWFLLYINFSVMGPRYKLLLLPFLVVSALFVLDQTRLRLSWKHGILAACVVLFSMNSHGLFYRSKPEPSPYGYNPIERSLEYRNTHRLQIRLARWLEKNFPDTTVGAPHVTAQTLEFHELGYVDDPGDVIIYGVPATHDLRPLPPWTPDLARNTIWVGFDAKMYDEVPFEFPIDPADRVIREFWEGDRSVTVFQGGVALEKMRRLMILQQRFAAERGR